MIDYYMVCTNCKIIKNTWCGDPTNINTTLPSEFTERHLKKGCSFKNINFCGENSNFYEDLDIENYIDDNDKYEDDFWDNDNA